LDVVRVWREVWRRSEKNVLWRGGWGKPRENMKVFDVFSQITFDSSLQPFNSFSCTVHLSFQHPLSSISPTNNQNKAISSLVKLFMFSIFHFQLPHVYQETFSRFMNFAANLLLSFAG
jgi:hypothetical protein